MNVNLVIKEFPNPNELPELLADGIKPLDEEFSQFDPEILIAIREAIENFNKQLDFFGELYKGLLSNNSFEVTLYLTQGFPDPYDAWFVESENAVVFNISIWDIDEISKDAETLLKHEVSHFLFHKVYPTPYKREKLLSDNNELLRALRYHVIDEGIAHFVAKYSQIDDFLSSNKDKKEKANRELNDFISSIEKEELSSSEKEMLLTKAFTGPYWDKFGDVSGLFEIYDLYKKSGISSIASMIKGFSV